MKLGEPRNTAAYGGKTQAWTAENVDRRTFRSNAAMLAPAKLQKGSPRSAMMQPAPVACDGRHEIERKQAVLDINGNGRHPGLVQDQQVHQAIRHPREETDETRSDQDTRPAA